MSLADEFLAEFSAPRPATATQGIRSRGGAEEAEEDGVAGDLDMAWADRAVAESNAHEGAEMTRLELVHTGLARAAAQQQRLLRELKDVYEAHFPELEKLVPGTADYARVVLRVGAGDVRAARLDDILPAQLCLNIALTATGAGAAAGVAMDARRAERAASLARAVLRLEDAHGALLVRLERDMARVAPNLVALTGASVAARLIAAAGGLAALAALPATTVQVLGADRRADLAGMSVGATVLHAGVIRDAPAVAGAPQSYREKMARQLASKATLAARIDAARAGAVADADAAECGAAMRAELQRRLEKHLEPAKPREVRALPVPDEAPKKRRGGRRARRMKERYGVTDVRRLANRVAFGTAAEEETFGPAGETGFGMLGRATEHSRLRKVAAQDRGILRGRSTAQAVVFAPVAPGSAGAPALTPSRYFDDASGFESVRRIT
jgi:U4/U6 small nuclear ribonucleoprotein PRP31